MRHKLEFAPVWLVMWIIGFLPRPLARAAGILLGMLVYVVHPRLRSVGMRNLQIAFPEKSRGARAAIVRGVFVSLGRQLAEFCMFPRYTRENLHQVMIYDGFENFDNARRLGKGVLFLTAHLGAWELGSFAHSLHGNRMNIVVRGLDNPYLDRMVDRYRTLHGNQTFSKQDFARGLLAAMHQGETVGLLMDTNMTPPQGVFVNFFGVPACTASGAAKVALHTGAAVVPAFTIWDSALGKYRVRFDSALPLVRTGDAEADAVANTAAFNLVIESYVRKFPDQWLWVHRRWKARPEGQPALYR